MRNRDVGILAVCALAILFSFSAHDSVAVHRLFFHQVDPAWYAAPRRARKEKLPRRLRLSLTPFPPFSPLTFPFPARYENGFSPTMLDRLPSPVVTDIDGDGTNEIVLATREPAVYILQEVRALPPLPPPLSLLVLVPLASRN